MASSRVEEWKPQAKEKVDHDKDILLLNTNLTGLCSFQFNF